MDVNFELPIDSAQGENAQIISDETRSDWARSELEPAQSTVAPDTRAQAVYGESASLRPQPNDPTSAADLQTAREWIADVSERNPNVRLASPNRNNPIEGERKGGRCSDYPIPQAGARRIGQSEQRPLCTLPMATLPR